MPTYEYECTECGRRSEAVQRFTDAPFTTCEACGGTLRKIFSSVGVVFKGSGFYKNDSRGTSGEPKPAAAASASAPTPASDASSSASPATAPTPAGPTTSSSSTE